MQATTQSHISKQKHVHLHICKYTRSSSSQTGIKGTNAWNPWISRDDFRHSMLLKCSAEFEVTLTDDEVTLAVLVLEWFRHTDKSLYADAFRALVTVWNKYVNLTGEYIENKRSFHPLKCDPYFINSKVHVWRDGCLYVARLNLTLGLRAKLRAGAQQRTLNHLVLSDI